jgi:hypothetical protein
LKRICSISAVAHLLLADPRTGSLTMMLSIPRKLLVAIVSAALASAASAAAPAPSAAVPSIYKLVDASGKITYTNSPVKGAVRVELDPITVIPSTPSGSLGGAAKAAQAALQAAAAPTLPPAPVLIPVQAVPTIAAPMAPAPAIAVATVTPISNPKLAKPTPASAAPDPAANLPVVKLSPNVVQGPAPESSAPPAFATAPAQKVVVATATPSAEAIAQQRRDELRLKTLAATIEREEQLLADANAQLTEERRASESFRKLRAGLAAKPDSTNPQAAAIKADIRAQVERHFERIRDLEDQVSMHQRNLEQYRQQSGGAPKAG